MPAFKTNVTLESQQVMRDVVTNVLIGAGLTDVVEVEGPIEKE